MTIFYWKGTIKSAITTLNITIITLALYPVYDFLLVLRVSYLLLLSTYGMPDAAQERRILPCAFSKDTRDTSLHN